MNNMEYILRNRSGYSLRTVGSLVIGERKQHSGCVSFDHKQSGDLLLLRQALLHLRVTTLCNGGVTWQPPARQKKTVSKNTYGRIF
jgi:hypothetical protein